MPKKTNSRPPADAGSTLDRDNTHTPDNLSPRAAEVQRSWLHNPGTDRLLRDVQDAIAKAGMEVPRKTPGRTAQD